MALLNFEKFESLNESTGMVCKKICNECPFSKKSPQGYLADYTVQDIVDLQNGEALFPCHKMMVDGDLDQEEVQQKIENGDMKLCRGYVESVIKSAKSPRYNQILKDAMVQAKAEGLSEDSMPIWDFKKHHS